MQSAGSERRATRLRVDRRGRVARERTGSPGPAARPGHGHLRLVRLLHDQLARYPSSIGYDAVTYVARRCVNVEDDAVRTGPTCSAVITPSTTAPPTTVVDLLFVGDTVDGRPIEIRPGDGIEFVGDVPAVIQQTVDIAFESGCDGVIAQRDLLAGTDRRLPRGRHRVGLRAARAERRELHPVRHRADRRRLRHAGRPTHASVAAERCEVATVEQHDHGDEDQREDEDDGDPLRGRPEHRASLPTRPLRARSDVPSAV